jgi:hypothetical protein
MPDEVVDVALETNEGDYFQFLNVRKGTLLDALDKALSDGAALSLVNIDSCALVVPWKLIRAITYLASGAEEREDAWLTLWERLSEDARQAG